jgi:hypothetical protein
MVEPIKHFGKPLGFQFIESPGRMINVLVLEISQFVFLLDDEGANTFF